MSSLSKRTGKITISYLAAVLVACLAVSTAAAQTTPTKFTTNSTQDDPNFLVCDYGTLTAHFTYSGFGICRQDQAGNCHLFVHNVTDAVITNPLNGKIATGSWTQNIKQASSIVTNIGGSLDLNVSGVGKVAHLSGRLIFDFDTLTFVFLTPSLEKSFAPALCSALQ
jgi:hypothetical protein